MIRWEVPGYVVAFTTRAGGVSSGVYESLNLTTRDRRRGRARRGEPAHRLRGARPRRGPARLQPAGALADGAPGARREARRAGRRALDRRAAGCRCSRCRPTACRSRSRAAIGRARSPCCTPAGAASPRAWSRPASRRSAPARRRRWSGRRSGRAATRSATRSPALFDADLTVGAEARSLERRRARAARGRCRDGRARRSLHAVPPRALLLAPAERPGARRPGGARCCRLTRSARASSACRRRSGPR